MKKILFSVSMIFALAGMSYAGMGFDAGSIGQQNVMDMRIHEYETRAKNKSAIIQREKAEEEGKVPVPTTIKTISNIRFSGNNAIPAGDLSRVVSSYIGKPASDSNLSNIRKLITKYYQANGFYSVVVIPETNSLTSGVITLQINEGTRNSITIDK